MKESILIDSEYAMNLMNDESNAFIVYVEHLKDRIFLDTLLSE